MSKLLTIFMELYNFLLFIIIIFLIARIFTVKQFQNKINIIINNGDLINFDKDQEDNKIYFKKIKAEIYDPDVFITKFRKHDEYGSMWSPIDSLIEYFKELDIEQYALDKTKSDLNKVPHELNIITVGKIEFKIKEKAKKLKKPSFIFSDQIITAWIFIFIIILLIIYLNKNQVTF